MLFRPITSAWVAVQNQDVNHPNRWDRTGKVVEKLPHRQYRVKMDGSGRISLRNRKFLRPITPFSAGLDRQASTTLPPNTPLPTTLPHTPAPAPHQSVEQQKQEVTGGEGGQTQTGMDEELDNPNPGGQELQHGSQHDKSPHTPGKQHAGGTQVTRRSGRERRPPRRL